MTFADYCRKLLPPQALSGSGPNVQEFHKYMSTTPFAGIDPLPGKYSPRWGSKEWSYTGADPGMTYVYVLGKPDGYLKIGVSNDPVRRVADLTRIWECRVWIIAMWLHDDYANVEQTVRGLLRPWKHPMEAEWYRVTTKKMLATVAKAMRLVDQGRGKYKHRIPCEHQKAGNDRFFKVKAGQARAKARKMENQK